MTKATKRTIGVICLLWLGTLLLLFANYKTKVYLEQLRSQVDAVTQQEQANATAVKRQPSRTMEDVLVRTDAQLVTTSFSNENYAAKAKSLVSLCVDILPTAKAGGFLHQPPLHSNRSCCVLHDVRQALLPVCPTVRYVLV